MGGARLVRRRPAPDGNPARPRQPAERRIGRSSPGALIV